MFSLGHRLQEGSQFRQTMDPGDRCWTSTLAIYHFFFFCCCTLVFLLADFYFPFSARRDHDHRHQQLPVQPTEPKHRRTGSGSRAPPDGVPQWRTWPAPRVAKTQNGTPGATLMPPRPKELQRREQIRRAQTTVFRHHARPPPQEGSVGGGGRHLGPRHRGGAHLQQREHGFSYADDPGHRRKI